MKNFTLDHTQYKSHGDVQITKLPNGLMVATAKKPVNSVVVSAFAKVGSRYENEAENGISHFLEHMVFKGTPTRSCKEISMEIENIGANINAYTSLSTTAFYVSGLADHIDPALDILSDMLKNPLLSEEDIVREHEVVIQEIFESLDDIADITNTGLMNTAFPQQSLGRHILGSQDNVESFDRRTVSDYLNRHYHTGSMLLAAVGNVDHDAFVEAVSKRFNDLRAGSSVNPEVARYVGGSFVHADDRFQQAQLMVAFPAPPVNDDQFPAYDLLSDVMGGGMSAPLFQEVREKRSLCYSVNCGVKGFPDTSIFVIGGSTTREQIPEFLTVSLGELQKIAAGQINDSDIARAKNQLIGQLLARSDSLMGTMRSMARDILELGQIRSLDETISKYSAITREDMMSAAQTLLQSKPTIAVAGNMDKAVDYEKIVLDTISV